MILWSSGHIQYASSILWGKGIHATLDWQIEQQNFPSGTSYEFVFLVLAIYEFTPIWPGSIPYTPYKFPFMFSLVVFVRCDDIT